MWQLAWVSEACMDQNGYIRKVKLMVATSRLDDKGKKMVNCPTYVERPIHKLVSLFSSEK